MTINQMMSISRESMNNNQYALTVVSHNIANVDTKGYSKQRAEFCESVLANYTTLVSPLNGAYIGSITSFSNQALNNAYMRSNTDYNYYNNLANMVKEMESIANEMGDAGLQKAISDFFTAAHNLNRNPTDYSARENYVNTASSVLSKFSLISQNMDNMRETYIGNPSMPYTMETSKLGLSLEDINQKLERISEINLEIAKSANSDVGSTNGLLDQRTRILDELSRYLPVTTTYNSNGTANVMVDGITLVRGTEVTGKLELVPGPDDSKPAVVQLVNKDGKIVQNDMNSHLTGGSVGAMLKMVSKSDDGFLSLSSMQEMIDNLVNDFATAVNDLQTYANGDIKAMCIETDPVTGEPTLIPATEPMFVGGPPFTAKSIKINDEIIKDKNLIATARVDTSVSGYEKNVGNADNMLLIAELRNERIIRSPGSAVADVTIDKYITNMTGKIGLQGKDLNEKADSQGLILQNADNNRLSATGVNMDEELADMIKYQRAYEASARMFSTADQILQVLVNLGR